MFMKITSLILLGALAGLVGCQSTQDQERTEKRELLQKLLYFQQTDTSNDDLVTLDEFKVGFKATGKKSIEELFAEFDLDGNGALSQKEWLQIK